MSTFTAEASSKLQKYVSEHNEREIFFSELRDIFKLCILYYVTDPKKPEIMKYKKEGCHRLMSISVQLFNKVMNSEDVPRSAKEVFDALRFSSRSFFFKMTRISDMETKGDENKLYYADLYLDKNQHVIIDTSEAMQLYIPRDNVLEWENFREIQKRTPEQIRKDFPDCIENLQEVLKRHTDPTTTMPFMVYRYYDDGGSIVPFPIRQWHTYYVRESDGQVVKSMHNLFHCLTGLHEVDLSYVRETSERQNAISAAFALNYLKSYENVRDYFFLNR